MAHFRFDTKRLPPVPEWMSESEQKQFVRSWRSLFRDFRFQMDDSGRYWLACQEAAGEDATRQQLGDQQNFNLELYQMLA